MHCFVELWLSVPLCYSWFCWCMAAGAWLPAHPAGSMRVADDYVDGLVPKSKCCHDLLVETRGSCEGAS